MREQKETERESEKERQMRGRNGERERVRERESGSSLRKKREWKKPRVEQNLVDFCWVGKMQFYLKVGKKSA